MLTVMVVFSQDNDTYMHTKSTILLNEVLLEDGTRNYNAQIEYFQLRRRVLKVYPYIDTIKQVMLDVDADLSTLSTKRSKRRYSRKAQRKIINTFYHQVTDLSRKEGVILSKLIHRDFDFTAYELIHSYRGGFQAFFWQNMSKLYDGDLKSIFDPLNNEQDVLIEQIIKDNF